MKQLRNIFRTKTNLWIALFLLTANGFAWLIVSSRADLPEVSPVLHPEIDEIRTHWNAGDAVGKTFAVTVTNQMAAETVAWLIEDRPNIKAVFSHPQVEMTPNGVTGKGLLHIGGLKIPVFGQIRVTLRNGRPFLEVIDLGVAQASAPGFVMGALQEQVAQAQSAYDALEIDVELTKIELRQGEVYLEGFYK